MLPDFLTISWFSKLGIMAWPLVLCSILSLAIILEKSAFLTKTFSKKKQIYKKLQEEAKTHSNIQKDIRDEIISLELSRLQEKYNSGIGFLRLIATTAPLLGLLGTIIGIIKAFKSIAAVSGPISAAIIADGLWEAMLTTAFGLFIALPSLFAAYFFTYLSSRQIEDFAFDLNKFSIKLELEKNSK